MDQATIFAFEGALGATDDVVLLLCAEAAGRAVDPSIAPRSAAAAIGRTIGYPFSNYDEQSQQIFTSTVLTRLASLRYLTVGPTVPPGNTYSWSY